MLRKTFTITLGALMMIGLTVVATPGQESGQATAREMPPFRTLSGVIRWRKSMGVPPTESICEPFYVIVSDPEKDKKKPVWFTNVLTPGRDDPEFYTCKYEFKIPTNKRLLVTAGLGDLGDPFSTVSSALARGDWPGGSKMQANPNVPKEILKAMKADLYWIRSFRPYEREVTLSGKGMHLTFELYWSAHR